MLGESLLNTRSMQSDNYIPFQFQEMNKPVGLYCWFCNTPSTSFDINKDGTLPTTKRILNVHCINIHRRSTVPTYMSLVYIVSVFSTGLYF